MRKFWNVQRVKLVRARQQKEDSRRSNGESGKWASCEVSRGEELYTWGLEEFLWVPEISMV